MTLETGHWAITGISRPVAVTLWGRIGWLRNPAPVDWWQTSHYFVGVSTIWLVVQDFATIHSIRWKWMKLCLTLV